MPILPLALVKPKGKGKKASKEEIAAWLKDTVGKKGITKVELSALFKASGKGQRLRLDQYTDIVSVDDEENVTLVSRPKLAP